MCAMSEMVMLNYVCHSEHDAHHRSRNFEKAKMPKCAKQSANPKSLKTL